MNCNLNIRGIFCNRTLNLNAIRAIGYDMDYTLVHYRMSSWEQRAYNYVKGGTPPRGVASGRPGIRPGTCGARPCDRHGTGKHSQGKPVRIHKKGFHGTRPLEFEQLRRVYQRTLVDLSEPRWYFLNTLFSISEACIFMQLVDLLDSRTSCPDASAMRIFLEMCAARLTKPTWRDGSRPKSSPTRISFVELDEETPLALLDQKKSGKKVLLISNSEWSYAEPDPDYAFDPFSAKIHAVAGPVRYYNRRGQKARFFHASRCRHSRW